MKPIIDETHAPTTLSWVESANGHREFPIQNLPLGIFTVGGRAPSGGVAIGDLILDLAAVSQSGILSGAAQQAAAAAAAPALNDLLSLGAESRRALRRALFKLLSAESDPHILHGMLHPAAEATLHPPARIGGYTDFFAGIHHARNAGSIFRPDSPLLPNYKHVPIGYHGRASSIRVSGAVVRRPRGQRKQAGDDSPVFGRCEKLDYELELGLWLGEGNILGQPIPISQAGRHIAGVCLLNDWSARDIQAWEYQPLGPFLAKNFMTTISPWIVTTEALAPFRVAQVPRPEGDPAPMPYLLDSDDQQYGALSIELEVFIHTEKMRNAVDPPHRLSHGVSTDLYWTPAQLIAHHTSNGCDLNSGDLLGTGTISSAAPEGFGSLLEHTTNGQKRIQLPSGETRAFLEDGDEIQFIARAKATGRATIGFGSCCGRVVA